MQPIARSITTARGTIQIREAKPTDATSFRELRLKALQDSPVAFTADYQSNVSHPPKYWEEMLTTPPDEPTMFLAKHQRSMTVPHDLSGSPADENDLLGMTGIARGGSPKTRHAATVWGVYVAPEWRGLHIAEELIQCCFDWARVRRIVIAKLGVAATNTAAIRCYERCGFKITGTEPRAVFYDSKYYDFYSMSCSLDGL